MQGAAIFYFHVIRSDAVWSRMSPHLKSLKGMTLRSTVKSSYSLVSPTCRSPSEMLILTFESTAVISFGCIQFSR